MNILFVSAEVAPFSKAGGLADVAGSLPQALSEYSDNIHVLTPLYGLIDQKKYKITSLGISGTVTLGDEHFPYTIYEAASYSNQAVKIWFVESDVYFARKGIYTEASGEGFEDNNERYFFFQLVAYDLIEKQFINPHVLHCNDHHTGLLPGLISTSGKHIKTVFTIHNFLYHGHFSAKERELLPQQLRKLLTATQWDNYSSLLEGVSHADFVTTVSQGYADELLAGENVDKHSLQRLLHTKRKMSGIVNGIDTDYWNPSKDQQIPYQYSVNDLSGKYKNKLSLLEQSGLKVDIDAPLIGSISRLVENKGFPLIVKVMAEMVKKGASFIFLGSGDPVIAKQIRDLTHLYPDHIAFEEGFNEPLAHLIEAGSDMFLMPSRFEPCGLNQLYSLQYGTIPIVNKTGGLGDTVEPWSTGTGTGFVFDSYDVPSLRNAMLSALEVYEDKSEWESLIKRAMNKDFSWAVSAKQYFKLYNT